MDVDGYQTITCTSKMSDVDKDFINPFLRAAHEVFLDLGKYPVQKGELTLKGMECFADDIMILMNVEGGLKGSVVFCMDEDTSKKFVSSFLMGIQVSQVDTMALNSLREFSIRVSEKAKRLLGELGHLTNVRHEVVFKQLLSLSQTSPFLTLSLSTPHGPVKVFFNIVRTH